LKQVVGAYAIVIVSKNHPEHVIAARKGSPLVVGLGKERGEFIFASDATPIVEYTNKVIYLKDGEIAIVESQELTIKSIENVVQVPYVQELELNLEQLEKGGYPHFMLKEIYEQPKSIFDSYRGRFDAKTGEIIMSSMEEYADRLKEIKRLILIGCGTSWHAGLVGEYLFEDLARVPVEVEYASEFRYRNPVIYGDDLIIAVSQSGETADSLAAMELAKRKGASVFGVCNVVGSSIYACRSRNWSGEYQSIYCSGYGIGPYGSRYGKVAWYHVNKRDYRIHERAGYHTSQSREGAIAQ
jgi:glucosamine--fructose-6-phosphate aminotransferase (isomerizing)